MNYRALFVPVTGDIIEVWIDNGDYKYKQRLVGGLLDVVNVERVLEDKVTDFDIWVDDEGLLKNKPLNARASVIAGRTLVGDAVITGPPDRDGDCTDVHRSVEEFVRVVDHVVVVAQTPDEQPAQPVATPSQED